MKHLIYYLAPLAILFAGCSKEFTESPVDLSANDGIVFTASFENDVETKTVLDDKTILWSGNESIVVFDADNKGYEYSTTDAGKSATFTQVGDEALTDPDTWYALYPYEENATFADCVFTATLQDEYTVSGSGSFADGMNIAVAKSSTTEFSFKNVLSWLKVSYKGLADVNRIEFRGNNNEVVAGTLLIDYTGDSPVASFKEGTGSTVMTVNVENSEESASSATSDRVFFFIPVLPGEFANGFTLTFISESGVSRTFAIESSITFVRNKPRSMFAQLSSDVYERVESLEQLDEVSGAKYLLVYPSGSEFRVFSFQKTMENIVAEADRLEDVHSLDDLKNQASTIYQNALKSNYILASSTDDGATITIDNQEEEDGAVLVVNGGYKNAETSLSAVVDGKSFTLGLENITAELKDNNAAVISAVLNGEDLVNMATTLRGHSITLTLGNCLDYVGAKCGLDANKLAMARELFVDLCTLVGEYTGHDFPVDLSTTVTDFYARYWDNIRDYAMQFGKTKKWGSIYPVGFYKADDGFTFNVPVPNKVWFYDFEESTSQDIAYFVDYWSAKDGYNNFPFKTIAEKFAEKLDEESFAAIQSLNFTSLGDTYQRYVDRFNDTLEEVYIYRLVE